MLSKYVQDCDENLKAISNMVNNYTIDQQINKKQAKLGMYVCIRSSSVFLIM